MRELAVVGDKVDGFGDIEAIAMGCRFHNCSHGQEPGCAVIQARSTGVLSALRWENYAKLQRELAFLERKTNKSAASNEKQKWKVLSKAMRPKKR
jgi:ribosome biogenesis GTPase